MFDIQEFLKSEQNTHQFTTENAYLNQVGLGTFTTGTLYSYFNNRGKEGSYTNRGVIRKADGSEILNIGDFLGTDYAGDPDWGTWEGWRKGDHTGSYTKQKYNDWTLQERTMSAPYTFSQLQFDDFTFSTADAVGVVADNPSQAIFNEDHFDIKRVPIKIQKASEDNFIKAITDQLFLNNSPLINVINMNDFMISLKRKKARSGDNGWQTLTGGKFGKGELFAIDEYLADIKASKYKHITCSGLLTFNIKMADERFQCPRTQWVTYNLSLFDAPPRQSPKPTAVLRSIEMAQIKRDATGRKYLSKTDGDASAADENNPGHKTAAEMKLSYNPYLNKWESGTQSILAKITTPIARAFFNPTVESLNNSDVEADLASPEESLHFAPASGLAMPIQMQNANPFQWAPGYALDAGCRADDKTKQVVTVFNFNPKKSFKVDDTVMLSEIDGVWHCVDLGEDLEEDQAVETSFAGQWQIQYFATNEDYFFKDDNENRVEPQVAERVFHKFYYAKDPKNGGNLVTPDVSKSAGVNYTDFTTAGLNPFYNDTLGDGYLQISSFDFMDNNIFGRRNKNALATTLGTQDAAGRSLAGGDENLVDNAAHSIYFGCLFPRGYSADSVNTMAEGVKTFNVTYHNSGVRSPNQGGSYFGSNAMLNIGSEFFGGVGQGVDNTNIYPFLEDQGIVLDDENNMIQYLPERSDKRSATDTFPDENFDEKRSRRQWFPNNYQSEPSMFYEYNRGTSRSLPHLPADIALNGSIDNTYGGPLYNIHRCRRFYEDGFNSNDLKLEVKKAINSATWLVQTPEVNIDPDVDYSSASAFGFEPTTPGQIQFRPLKMELYSSYNTAVSGGLALQTLLEPGSIFDMRPATNAAEARWSSLLWSQMLSLDAPYGNSEEFTAGALEYNRRFRLLGDGDGTNPGIINPLYRGVQQGTAQDGSQRLAFNKYNNDVRTSSRRHTANYWDDAHFNWMAPNSDTIAANAYGVIGAVTTVTVNSEITFTTDQYFGMQSIGRFRMGSVTRPAVSSQIPSWGGPSDLKYDSNNNIDLSVTVYHAHPRQQTIYDPRYFCVHHFNELPEYEGYTTSSLSTDQERYLEDSNGASWPATSGANIQTPDGDFIPYKYHLDITESQIGIREPSIFNDVDLFPLPLASGSKIFKNGFKVGTDYKRLLPSENWHLNVTRVGKLLPYSYQFMSLTSPFASGTAISSIDMLNVGANNEIEHGTAEENVDKIIYTSLGQDLQQGDIVGNSAFKVFFSVENPQYDADGNVISLQLQAFDAGENISTSSFANADDEIVTGFNGGLPLSMVAGFGKNFKAAILNGKITPKSGLDTKPQVIAREQQLSLPADNTSRIDVQDGISFPFGYVTGEKEQTLNIASSDFRFFGDGQNPYEAHEQYINLNITGT